MDLTNLNDRERIPMRENQILPEEPGGSLQRVSPLAPPPGAVGENQGAGPGVDLASLAPSRGNFEGTQTPSLARAAPRETLGPNPYFDAQGRYINRPTEKEMEKILPAQVAGRETQRQGEEMARASYFRNQNQENAGGLARLARNDALGYLDQLLLQQHGIEEKDARGRPTGSRVLSPYAQEVKLKFLPQIKSMEDVPKVMEQMKGELETGKNLDLFNNPATGPGTRAQMLARYRQEVQAAGQTPDANVENFIKTQKVTPANLAWFQKNYQKLQAPAQPAPSPGAPAAAGTRETPNLLDLITRMGTTFKHELSPPGTLGETIFGRRGKAVPTLQEVAARRVAERKRLWAEEALPGRAEGGPVDEDQPYVVGEKGPEIFVPAKKGVVVPDLSTLAPVQETKEDEVALAGKG